MRSPLVKLAAVQKAPPSVLRPVTTGSVEVVRQKNHARRKNLIGQKFGKLTVFGAAPNERHRNGRYYAMWYCRCACGKRTTHSSMNLLSGDVKSCGCNRHTGKWNLKHGHAKHGGGSKMYYVWTGMLARCGNPKTSNYHRYGGRGIRVCARWKKSFINFLRDMGQKPFGTSLDRIDNNGNYCPANCRWATRLVQANNTSRNKYVIHDGMRLTYSQWAKRLGISTTAFWMRINTRMWSIKRAINTPPRKYALSY